MNDLAGRTLVSKSYLNQMCLQLLRIQGLTQPSAESLSRLHSWIMCSHTAWWQRGENYYFQMFLPEVAWSRTEPRDRMLEFYSWPSYAPSARCSPTSYHVNMERWEPELNQQGRAEQKRLLKGFLGEIFEELDSQILISLVGGTSLPYDAIRLGVGKPCPQTV